MNALEVLREMHVDAKETFQRIEEARSDQRGPLWAKLRSELMAHERIEKQFVYGPMATEAAGRDEGLANWDRQHQAKVDIAERLMDDLGRLEPREDTWLGRLAQLRSSIEDHIFEEEMEVWPRIRAFWGEEKLTDVGGKVQAAKMAAGICALGATAAGAISEIFKGPSDEVKQDQTH